MTVSAKGAKRAFKRARGTAPKPLRPGRAKTAADTVRLSDEECRRLAADIAYFRAARYRDAAPGECREEDRRAAQRQLRALLRRQRTK
jgi:hypothetical protein